MDATKISALLQLLVWAWNVGEPIFSQIWDFLHSTMTPVDLVALEAAWDADAARSAANAGVPYIPDTPLPTALHDGWVAPKAK